MRSLLAAVLAVSITTLGVAPMAHAQPGADPQQPGPYAAPPAPPPPPQPQQYPQQYPPQPGYPQQYPQPYPPQPGYPQPYQPRPYMGPGYGPPIQLSPEDQELLAEGEISDGTMLGGVLAAVLLGFGSGQALEGRWSERGWIFTLGEIGAIVLLVYGATRAIDNCNTPDSVCGPSDAGVGEMVAGALGLTALRIWEVVDAVTGPKDRNARVRDLRMRMGMRPAYARVTPYIAPVAHDTGWSAGVALHF